MFPGPVYNLADDILVGRLERFQVGFLIPLPAHACGFRLLRLGCLANYSRDECLETLPHKLLDLDCQYLRPVHLPVEELDYSLELGRDGIRHE